MEGVALPMAERELCTARRPRPRWPAPLVPPDFHWGLVLLFTVLTCGLFAYAWIIVEAAFVRKLRPQSNGLLLVILGIAGFFVGSFLEGFVNALNPSEGSPVGGLVSLVINLGALVVYFVGLFQIRSDMEDYYNTIEPINLRLSGVMTFFFAIFYFQYHFSRIAQWKKSGVLQPQS
jgi:hypothetical protein